MNDAYLLLGSNEGDRKRLMEQALTLIDASYGTIVQRSHLYETAAWGLTDQASFLNMVVHLQTTKTPDELLTGIQGIEIALGRKREIQWGPRTLDIDLLLFNDEIINTPTLTVPHPHMHERRFTLIPLAEIAPGYMHPILKKTISTLLADCPDQLDVHQYKG